MVARALHNASQSGDFVPIDCGSLVGPLMESELFGHTRGAFTGAADAKRGLIELADGGTAFFDEIGDLPLDLQVKLLRLLAGARVSRHRLPSAPQDRPARDRRHPPQPQPRRSKKAPSARTSITG